MRRHIRGRLSTRYIYTWPSILVLDVRGIRGGMQLRFHLLFLFITIITLRARAQSHFTYDKFAYFMWHSKNRRICDGNFSSLFELFV